MIFEHNTNSLYLLFHYIRLSQPLGTSAQLGDSKHLLNIRTRYLPHENDSFSPYVLVLNNKAMDLTGISPQNRGSTFLTLKDH